MKRNGFPRIESTRETLLGKETEGAGEVRKWEMVLTKRLEMRPVVCSTSYWQVKSYGRICDQLLYCGIAQHEYPLTVPGTSTPFARGRA